MSTATIVVLVLLVVGVVVVVMLMQRPSSSTANAGGWFGGASSSSGWGDIFGRLGSAAGDIVERAGGSGSTQTPATVAADIAETEAAAGAA